MKTRRFFDGIDSYQTEIEAWIKSPGVPGLIGVFPLPEEQYNLPGSEKLQTLDRSDLQLIDWKSDIPPEESSSAEVIRAAGCCCGVIDQFANVRSIVFLREEVHITEGEHAAAVADGIRLILLIHELGHAQDMYEQTNFCHKTKRLKHTSAEAYAHRYVINTCRKIGYRIPLCYYLNCMVEQSKSSCPVLSTSAKEALNCISQKELSSYLAYEMPPIEQQEAMMKKAGRWKDFEKRVRES